MKFLACKRLINTFNNLDDVKKFVSFEPHCREFMQIHGISLKRNAWNMNLELSALIRMHPWHEVALPAPRF